MLTLYIMSIVWIELKGRYIGNLLLRNCLVYVIEIFVSSLPWIINLIHKYLLHVPYCMGRMCSLKEMPRVGVIFDSKILLKLLLTS